MVDWVFEHQFPVGILAISGGRHAVLQTLEQSEAFHLDLMKWPCMDLR